MEVQELEKIIRQQEMTNASTFKVLMRKVYLWMTLALMITGITAASFLIYFVFIPLFFIVATFIYSKIQTAIKQEKQVYI